MARTVSTGDLWWKNAVIYCVDVETYYDSDGDGIGDLAGLTQRVDYLAELGVTCLWLMPFYPTPDRDDGYDVTDLFGVDSRLGTHGDLVELIRAASDRGIRVIADLVVNHTSDAAPVVQGGPAEQGQPLPRLLRLALRPAAGHLRQGRLPRQGGQHLGARRAHRRVVPAPLLLPPARPQLRQPDGARPHREVHRVLAAARAGRLPRGRRAVPHRRRRHRRRRRTRRPARLPEGAAVVPRATPGRRDPARRGQPAPQGAARLLRRLRRATSSP